LPAQSRPQAVALGLDHDQPAVCEPPALCPAFGAEPIEADLAVPDHPGRPLTAFGDDGVHGQDEDAGGEHGDG